MENETKVTAPKAKPKFCKKNIMMFAIMGALVIVIGGLTTTLVAMGGSRGSKSHRSQRTEMTYEQRAERQQQAQARVAQRFADGEITQEEYEQMVAAIEAGQRIASGRSGRNSRSGNEAGRSRDSRERTERAGAEDTAADSE
ncbi:MAG: SHOCT domain-containing protein [Defluviitaleaceae bacterium]|nr:SHOCT domain-containing protein [Defluviitaleaceae bacterium]